MVVTLANGYFQMEAALFTFFLSETNSSFVFFFLRAHMFIVGVCPFLLWWHLPFSFKVQNKSRWKVKDAGPERFIGRWIGEREADRTSAPSWNNLTDNEPDAGLLPVTRVLIHVTVEMNLFFQISNFYRDNFCFSCLRGLIPKWFFLKLL